MLIPVGHGFVLVHETLCISVLNITLHNIVHASTQVTARVVSVNLQVRHGVCSSATIMAQSWPCSGFEIDWRRLVSLSGLMKMKCVCWAIVIFNSSSINIIIGMHSRINTFSPFLPVGSVYSR